MDGSPICECGKEMSDCSIHPSTPEKWIAFMQDSLAKTLVSLESKQGLLKEPDRGFTVKYCVLLGLLDPDTSSWKMWPLSRVKDLKRWSKTWPKWGMTLDGCAYEHPMWEHRITVTGGSFFPTPVSSDATTGAIIGKNDTFKETANGNLRKYNSKGTNGSLGLARHVRFWPTPTAHNSKEGGYPAEHTRNTPTLAAQAGGVLNPVWVEWLMGFPIGFTDSKEWVTPKSRSKRQLHSKPSVKDGSTNANA
jgi:hypothetical protein